MKLSGRHVHGLVVFLALVTSVTARAWLWPLEWLAYYGVAASPYRLTADFEPTRLVLAHESFYASHLRNVPLPGVTVLVYESGERGNERRVTLHLESIASPVEGNRVFRVVEPIPGATRFARDITPFTVVDRGKRRHLVSYLPWWNESDSWWGRRRSPVEHIARLVMENQTTLFGQKVYASHRHVDLKIEGGNLVTNGGGVCLTSYQTWLKNSNRATDTRVLFAKMRAGLGCETVVFVDVMASPSHADMIAIFEDGGKLVMDERTRVDLEAIREQWPVALEPEFWPVPSVTTRAEIAEAAAAEGLGVGPGKRRMPFFTSVQLALINQNLLAPSWAKPTLESAACAERLSQGGRHVHYLDVKELVESDLGGIHCSLGQLH